MLTSSNGHGRSRRLRRVAIVLASAACGCGVHDSPGFTAAHATAVADSARAFARTVAEGVTRRGPAAWRDYFLDTPAFFMASEGRLIFPNSDSASRGIQALKRIIARIELRWTDSVRVDPLGPGLAIVAMPYYELRVDSAGHRIEETGYLTGLVEHRAAGWQFRDAHWSVVQPSAAVP